MKSSPRATGDRVPLLITVGLFVVMLACLPFVTKMDDRVDGDRPMYKDVEQMLDLQEAYVQTGQPPIEAQLGEGGSLMVGTKKFSASDGVTLSVRATGDDNFCVSARNEAGTKTERCSD